jgi:hypothetical protein
MRVQESGLVQWNRAILLDDSHKLDSWPLEKGVEDPKVNYKNYMAPHFGGKINWFKPKVNLKNCSKFARFEGKKVMKSP